MFAIINQIADDYLSLKRNNFELFEQRANDALQECKDTVHKLVNGHMKADPAGKFSIGRRGIQMASSSVKAVSCEPLELWRSPHWKTGLKANADAIKRGVKITRIFIQDQEALSVYKDVLQDHYKAGAEVLIVSPDKLEEGLIESYFIVDNRILAEFYFTKGKLVEEMISINSFEVKEANDKFGKILRNAEKYEGT